MYQSLLNLFSIFYQSLINLSSISYQSLINLLSISYQSLINLSSISHQSLINLLSISHQSPINLSSISYQSHSFKASSSNPLISTLWAFATSFISFINCSCQIPVSILSKGAIMCFMLVLRSAK